MIPSRAFEGRMVAIFGLARTGLGAIRSLTAGGTAVDLAMLGARVLAVGAIGRDLGGDFLVHSLEVAGVDADASPGG